MSEVYQKDLATKIKTGSKQARIIVPLFFPGREARHSSHEEWTSPLERLSESKWQLFSCS